ncbi:MAG: PAS domain-containing sensor histidine kinase [Betaproteobacteria bacterium]
MSHADSRIGEIDARLARAVGAILRVLTIALALILAATVLSGAPPLLQLALCGFLASMAPLHILHRRGRNDLAATAVVVALVLFATIANAAYGSIRGSGTLAYLGAAIVAGMLLGSVALSITVALSSASIGALIWLEAAGLLPAPGLRVGVQHWIINTVMIAGIAAIVYYIRTLLVQTIARLDKSERRLATLFRTSPAALVVTRHPEGRVVDVNTAYERIFAARRTDVIGGTATENRAWTQPAERERFLAELQARGRVLDFRTQLRRQDGAEFEALISAERIVDGDEDLLLSAITDFSTEARAREELRRSDERFRLAFELCPIGMTITRVSDGRYLALNRADQRTLGYTREEMLGRTTLERGAWPDATARTRFIEMLHREGTVENFETRMRDRSGRLVTCAIWAALVELDGEPCVLASTINVTNQKSEEALIREVAEGVSGVVGEPFFRSLVEHMAAATHTDMAIVGEIVDDGRRIRPLAQWRDQSLFPGAGYALAGTPCELVLAKGDTVLIADEVDLQFPVDTMLREEGYRSYVGAPLRDAAGRQIGILSVLSRRPLQQLERMRSLFLIFAARAQSELLRIRHEQEIRRFSRELESRVRERTEQYEAANRELEAFSYSVSHDLRAPLRTIEGFTTLLQESLAGRLDASEQETFARVLTGVHRMRELIEDLLGLARVSRGEMTVVDVDLSAIALDVADQLRARDPGRAVAFSVEPGMRARGDRNLIRIALENLLENAWKFSARQPAASISFGATGLEGGERAYFVRDDGAGFDMRYARRLFSPFQRLHAASEFEGTGIGLATVQRIIARHGGRVWAQSAPDQGATFHFTLDTGRGTAG